MIPDFTIFAERLALASCRCDAILSRELIDSLGQGHPVTLALPGSGGRAEGGWPLVHAVLTAAAKGQRVLWSTQTRSRRRNSLAMLRRGVEASSQSLTLAEAFGLADFASPSRIRRLGRALATRGAEASTLAALERMAARGGLLADAEQDEGTLPAPAGLLCLTPTCPEEEIARAGIPNRTTSRAGIVLQSHATTLHQARLGKLRADIVVFEEATAIPATAATHMEFRLPLAELDELARRADIGISEPLSALQARANDKIAWCDEPMARTLQVIADALSPRPLLPRHHGPVLSEALAEMAARLCTLANSADSAGTPRDPHRGFALVRGMGPTLAEAALDPARWLGPTLSNTQVVLCSPCLQIHEPSEDAMTAACRRLGFAHVRTLSRQPAPAVHLSFHLAARETAPPFAALDGEEQEQRPKPDFYDAAAEMIRAARARGGRSIVLCAGFGDVEELEHRLSPSCLLHRRGETLAPLLAAFEQRPDALLVTPGAWVGAELPAEIANLVLLRLPVAGRDHIREALLRQILKRRGFTGHDTSALLEREVRNEVVRQVAMAFELALGNTSPCRSVWIADPRFPLPAGMVVEVWRGLSQGPAAAWQELGGAIPRSLRIPSGRSAYDRAQVFAFAPPVTPTDLNAFETQDH